MSEKKMWCEECAKNIDAYEAVRDEETPKCRRCTGELEPIMVHDEYDVSDYMLLSPQAF